MSNYLVFDLETNGVGKFRPPTQTVTQLAFIKFDENGNTLDQYSSLVKGATEINNSIPSVKFTLDEINSKGIDLKTVLERFLDAVTKIQYFMHTMRNLIVQLLKEILLNIILAYLKTR